MGYKHKNLILVGSLLAMSLQADGWYLRAQNVWHKPNAMPSSVRDRPGLDYEYVYMFSKKKTYYFDMETVKQTTAWERWGRQIVPKHRGSKTAAGHIQERSIEEVQELGQKERNLRTVWSIPTRPFKGSHFATFPPELVETCVAASTPEHGSCPECGSPWRRVVEKLAFDRTKDRIVPDGVGGNNPTGMVPGSNTRRMPDPETRTVRWERGCNHDADPVPAIVLDPFVGSGTTAFQCARMGRRCAGIDLKEEYLAMTVERFREGQRE